MKNAVNKETGLRHLFAAAIYSWGGFLRLIKEQAFRHELLAFFLALLVFLAVGATIPEMTILTVLFLTLFGFEALNTAVEELVDRISPEISAVGKNAKDLGSFAVLCLVAASGIYFLVTVSRHLFFP